MLLAIRRSTRPNRRTSQNTEWFVVENIGDKPFSTAGCAVAISKGGGRPRPIGTIDPGFTIAPGAKVRVVTGNPGKKARARRPRPATSRIRLPVPRRPDLRRRGCGARDDAQAARDHARDLRSEGRGRRGPAGEVAMPETLLSRFFWQRRPAQISAIDDLSRRRGDCAAKVPAGWRSVARLVRDLAAGILESSAAATARRSRSCRRRAASVADDRHRQPVGARPDRRRLPDDDRRPDEVRARALRREDRRRRGRQAARQGTESGARRPPRDGDDRRHRSHRRHALAEDRRARRCDRSWLQGQATTHRWARVAAIKLEDAAIFIYTSGTTGPPKGAVLTHGNLVGALEAISAVPLVESDVGFSFLPLAHSLQRLADYRALWSGVPGWYGRAIDTVADDLAVASPTVMASVPRIFEKIYAKINETAAASGPRRKKTFDWAVRIGREAARLRREGKPVPTRLESQLQLARLLVYDKLRARLGGKVRLFFTGGAPIAAEILEFFEAAGIQILEAWGMTETFKPPARWNLPDAKKIGTIGRPLPMGITMKLDVDNEILIKGPNVFSGYHKDDEATKASFTSDGFFKTGADIGTCRRRRLLQDRRPQEGPDHHCRRQEHRAAEHREPDQDRPAHLAGHGGRRSPPVPRRARLRRQRASRKARSGGRRRQDDRRDHRPQERGASRPTSASRSSASSRRTSPRRKRRSHAEPQGEAQGGRREVQEVDRRHVLPSRSGLDHHEPREDFGLVGW